MNKKAIFRHTNIRIILIILTLVFLVIAYVFDLVNQRKSQDGINVQHISEVLHSKEQEAQRHISELLSNLKTDNPHVFSDLDSYEKKLNVDGISLLAYRNDSLIFWSTNSIEVPRLYRKSFFAAKFKQLHHGWFRIINRKYGKYNIIALIVIKKEYQYQNSYLHNAFNEEFNLPKWVNICIDKTQGVKFYSLAGDYLFSLKQGRGIFQSSVPQYKASIFYALAFIFFLICSAVIIMHIRETKKARWAIFVYAVTLLTLRYVMLIYSVPNIFHSLELFYPALYAASEYSPSLGDFLLNSLSIFTFIFVLSKKIMLKRPAKKNINYIVLFLALLSIYIVFFIQLRWFRSLILDSSMSFQVFNFSYITSYTFVGYFIMVILFFTFLYYCRIFIKYSSKILTYTQYILGVLFVSPICILIIYFFSSGFDLSMFVFPPYILMLLSFLPFKKCLSYRNAIYTIGLLLSTLFIVAGVNKYSREKEIQDKKITALNLAMEYDQASENLLVSIDSKIKKDEYLSDQCTQLPINDQWIAEYVRDEYFRGFWNRFNIQVTLCYKGEQLMVDSELNTQDCHSFFSDMKKKLGEEIPGTNFYFLNEFNGMISYLGVFSFTNINNKDLNLYIRVDSYPGDEGVGYPDLLLDENFEFSALNKNFSYAKYANNKLITSSGDFHFYLNEERLIKSDSTYMLINVDGFNLFRYRFDNNSVYLASPEISLYNRLITVPYIFVIICLCALILYCLERFFHLSISFSSFKYRIQFGMLGVLLLFFIFLVGGSVVYSLHVYNHNKIKYLSGKLALVQRELFSDISSAENLKNNSKNKFNEVLRSLSDIISVDIHVYNLEGGVISTSRNEIFDKKLQDHKMNYNAFYQLSKLQRTHFIHSEQIGDFVYLSAYDAIIDKDNNVVAYVNLPYFVKKGVIEQDMFNLVMAGLNMYLFVMLFTIFMSLIISNTIIRPLQLLQAQFKKIRYGSTSEKLVYNKNDELGDLVLEYNKMLDELDNSALLLAKSERESAWREMAKQIAHEIKNPLTPMKLNIQFLQRKWNDKIPDWDMYFIKMSNNIIEQIDALSNIASAFSNFAKMPTSNNESCQVSDILKHMITLYNTADEDIDIILNITKGIDYKVFIDREQFNRVFINIIKNAKQSMPEDIKGIISINLNQRGSMFVVEITDNGSGMTPEVKEKLFMPNFTTKSSGMGLGLAISRQIVENAKGRIYVESTLNVGSTFYVEIPKAD